MSVRLNGSTSGYTELDAPAVAGNNTIKMPASSGAAGQRLGNGATAGTLEYSDNIVSGTAQASTSGTSIDFTGIPSWVKRVTVILNGVSTSGAADFRLRLGTSGGIASSGYIGSVAYAGGGGYGGGYFSSGFDSAAEGTPSLSRYGSLVLLNISGNRWVLAGAYGSDSGTAAVNWSFNGAVTLSGTLDRIRITTVNGTDTFDAGTINILYE